MHARDGGQTMRRLLPRRGMGLAEVVVAMAIIVVVSVTAMSMIMRFSIVSGNMTQINEGINVVEKGMECFKFADNSADFIALVYLFIGAQVDVSDQSLYVYEGSGYTVRMKVIYGTYSATFLGTVTDAKGRMVLSIPRYEKYY